DSLRPDGIAERLTNLDQTGGVTAILDPARTALSQIDAAADAGMPANLLALSRVLRGLYLLDELAESSDSEDPADANRFARFLRRLAQLATRRVAGLPNDPATAFAPDTAGVGDDALALLESDVESENGPSQLARDVVMLVEATGSIDLVPER